MNMTMLAFAGGLLLGGFLGVVFMCLLQASGEERHGNRSEKKD